MCAPCVWVEGGGASVTSRMDMGLLLWRVLCLVACVRMHTRVRWRAQVSACVRESERRASELCRPSEIEKADSGHVLELILSTQPIPQHIPQLTPMRGCAFNASQPNGYVRCGRNPFHSSQGHSSATAERSRHWAPVCTAPSIQPATSL